MISAIGNTPLIQLKRLPDADSAEVWVKWEGANPTGSMKDRMALAMIMGAESIGLLEPGGIVLDYTGGSTGSSLAMVCASRGYKAHFVSSDAFSEAKLQTMRLFGATVEIIPSENKKITKELITRCCDRVQQLTEVPGTFFTDQFNNVDNRRAYHAMAKEILGALQGRVDAFVTGVGTGGSFSGNAEYLKEQLPLVSCYAVEPENSQPIAGLQPTGGHRLEGMGAGFVPGTFRLDLCDGTYPISDAEAIATARLLAKKEGLFGGTSSGANVAAALKIAKDLGPGHRVVTIICDSGLKYIDGELYRE